MISHIFNHIIRKICYFGFFNLSRQSFLLFISLKWLKLLKKIILFFTLRLPYLYPIPILNSKNSRFNVIAVNTNTLSGPLPKILGKSIGIHLHLYYLDLASDILDRLQNLQYSFDLYISIAKAGTSPNLQSQLRKKLPMAKNIIIQRAPNLGRDLGPLIALFGKKLSSYDIVGHFHTKKSTHLEDGLDWYRHILDTLLGPKETNKNHINHLVKMVSQTNSLAYPDQYLKMTNSEDGWEDDKIFLENTLKQYTDINLKDYPAVEFTQGSMFWSHSIGIKKFLMLPITYKSFNKKKQKNNSLEHILERLILIYASKAHAKLYKIHNEITFSILIQTDQRLDILDVLPKLTHLKSIQSQGEVLIITDKPIPSITKIFNINPWIKAKIISCKSHSRAVKMNQLLRKAKGQIIIFKADDFKLNAEAIKSHLNFHKENPSTKSICLGMSFIKNKTIYSAWLEKNGFLFGIPFKRNISYRKKEIDFFYSGNASMKRKTLQMIGIFNESCEFDCTDDWLMWKNIKKNGYQVFHVPACDVEHNHQVCIRDRFVGLIQTGWNASHLGIKEITLERGLDVKIQQLHQELMRASVRLTRPKELFLLIEQIGPQLGIMLYERKIELTDMYSARKIFGHIFSRKNLSIPDFDAIENNIRMSGPLKLFRLFGRDGFQAIG